MFRKYFLLLIIAAFVSQSVFAQYDAPLYASYTTEAARTKMNERLINNTINKNLSLPLNEDTEDSWQDAFNAMEVLNYATPFTEIKVHEAFENILERSPSFQRALLELVYTMYPGRFLSGAQLLLNKTVDPKIFAMSSEYILQHHGDDSTKIAVSKILRNNFKDSATRNPILFMLQTRLATDYISTYTIKEVLNELFKSSFLSNQVVMFSFQRKNRDYPGIALVRNRNGVFVTDSSGKYFSVPQLARGISNLPGYLTNGNTPQGIFRMFGFGVSGSNFIGPTANVQMGMPVELGMRNFFDDSTLLDTVWSTDRYQRLVPSQLRNYFPLFHSYYAGLAGRSEIIAHGTTIDPVFYKDKPYYPLTPTQGCLCTKEIWDGKRMESDQQKLINALLTAGGGKGYCVVIELDDNEMPVTLNDLLPYLPKL